MKKLVINRITLENFKGVQRADFTFSPDVNVISGRNGTGKTTIADAFYWVFFDSDSNGRSNFHVQTNDAEGVLIPKIETKVSIEILEVRKGQLDVAHIFTRVLTQKWVKKRKSKGVTFDGVQSTYSYNDVPLNMSDYNKRIDDLCVRDLLRMLTSITHFTSLQTKERRAIIDEIANLKNLDQEILAETAYELLRKSLGEKRNIQELRQEVAAKIRKLKEELNLLPTRRDEAFKLMPEKKDFDNLRKLASEAEKILNNLDNEMQVITGAADNSGIVKELNRIAADKAEIETTLRENLESKIDAIKQDLRHAKNGAEETEEFQEQTQKDIDAHIQKLEDGKEKILEISKRWDKLDEQSPDTLPESCASCGHVFTTEERAEKGGALVEAFNLERAEKYRKLESEANILYGLQAKYTKEIEVLRAAIAESLTKHTKLNARIVEAEKKIAELPPLRAFLEANKEYVKLVKKEQELRTKLSAKRDNTRIEAIETEKESVRGKLNKLLAELSAEAQIKNVEKRIEEIDDRTDVVADSLSEQEEIAAQIADFERQKADITRERVDSLFQIVTFRLYEKNVTNEDEKSLCEVLVNGVPYSTNLNTGLRINAGMDICIALQKHYGIITPIWVDNIESVSDIVVNNESGSQLITLRVSDGDSLILT